MWHIHMRVKNTRKNAVREKQVYWKRNKYIVLIKSKSIMSILTQTKTLQ
jgi:hypothetical protein